MAFDLKEVVSIIKSGEWLQSVQFISADMAKNKGGQLITLQRCRIARRKSMQEHGSAIESNTGFTKNARHNENFTLNLELQNGLIRKIHPVLITKLNGTAVI
ncbi:MAG: hypothetical protein H7211_14445 [Aquabacterium sp.]|nr:hypothetical protein [Ferruginibacter sp.]